MKITIKDLTPSASTLELMKIKDVFGSAVVVKGWR